MLSSKDIYFTTNFTTKRRSQLAKFCSDLPHPVISEQTIKHPKSLAKQGSSGQKGANNNYDKSTIHLPRQEVMTDEQNFAHCGKMRQIVPERGSRDIPIVYVSED